jgi:hypothetical protein
MNNIIKFPTIVMDDFYEDADSIYEYASGLEYFPDPLGKFAGKRTLPLVDINPELNMYCCKKLFSLFFDLSKYNVFGWKMSTSFVKVQTIGDKTTEENNAWIHIDSKSLMAAVVYLSKNADPDSGTSLYKPKPNIDLVELDNITLDRCEFYKTGKHKKDYISRLNNYNSNFDLTLEVKNYYNRVIAYDSNIYHKATNHYSPIGERLTQVFFLHDIQTDAPLPTYRVHSITK